MTSRVEHLSKRVVLGSTGLALVLHLAVDPAVGPVMALVAAGAATAAWLAARRWPSHGVAAVLFAAPLAPEALSLVTGIAALNIFYTVILAALLVALAPQLDSRAWHLPSSWRPWLAGWGLLLAVAWPVLILREAGPWLAGLRDVGALASWSLLTTPQVESWILHATIAQLVGLLWLDWLCKDLSARWPVVRGLWFGITAASLVAAVQGTVDLTVLSSEPWISLRRAPGTLLDANAYGALAAICAPLAFVWVGTRPGPATRLLQLAVLATNWTGAWMSGSRTALICGAVGTLLLIVALIRDSARVGSASRHTSSLVAGAAVVVVLLMVGATAVGPVRRMLEVGPPGRSTVRTLWSRGGYGTVALRMIRDYPLVGVGVGSFNWMAPDYWRALSNDKLPFDNAQNWWRHQVAELGVMGSVPVLCWSMLLAWASVVRKAPPPSRVEASALRGILWGTGIASMVGMPTQNPLVLVAFFAVAARFEWLTRPQTGTEWPDRWSRISSLAWPIIPVLATGYALGHLVLGQGVLAPQARARAGHRDYIVGTYPTERSEDGRFRWTRRRATFTLTAVQPHLVIRYHVEHPDVDTRPVKVRITTPCQTLVDDFRQDTGTVTRAFELPAGAPFVQFDVEVSRTWRPSDVGLPDRRSLGAAIQADFVGEPGVVASISGWVPLQPCGPV